MAAFSSNQRPVGHACGGRLALCEGSMKEESFRLVVADDHALFREGLRGLFSATSGIELVVEAAVGEETLDLVEKAQPDIVLMDINMPDLSG